MLQIWLVDAAQAAKSHLQAEVADPFIELHTGPGRGYPIFYVAERGEKIEVLKRKTDWFKVRTQRGKVGWVNRTQMENTLVELGVKKSFRDALLAGHDRAKFEVGFAAGAYDSDPVVIMRGDIWVLRHFAAELSLSQVSGDFASSVLLDANLLAYPVPEWRAAPFLTIGVGRFKSTPKGTLIGGSTTEDTSANAGIGVRVRIGRRFAFRADWRNYVVLFDSSSSGNFSEYTVGFNFVF